MGLNIMRLSKRFYIILSLFIITGMVLFLAHKLTNMHHGTSVSLPMEIGQWKGADIPMDPVALSMIQPDAYIYRNYMHGQLFVNLYIGWYETMEKSDLAHSPLVCYQGQGWVVRDQRERRIPVAVNHDFLDAQRMIIEKAGQGDIVLYWFQTEGYSTGELGKMRLRMLCNKVFGRPNTNCFVRVSTTTQRGQGNEEKYLDGFATEIYSQLHASLQK